VKDAILENLGLEDLKQTWQPASAERKRPRDSNENELAKEQKRSYWAKYGVKTSPGTTCIQTLADGAGVTWNEFDELLVRLLQPGQQEASAASSSTETQQQILSDAAAVWDLLTSTSEKEIRQMNEVAIASWHKVVERLPQAKPNLQAVLANWLAVPIANPNIQFDQTVRCSAT
jgi:hypothetical protein